ADASQTAGVLVGARGRTAGPRRGDAPRRFDERNSGVHAYSRRHLVAYGGRDRVLPVDDVGLLGFTLALPLGPAVVNVGGGTPAGEGDIPSADLLVAHTGPP